jgi:hypothetical protein
MSSIFPQTTPSSNPKIVKEYALSLRGLTYGATVPQDVWAPVSDKLMFFLPLGESQPRKQSLATALVIAFDDRHATAVVDIYW